MAVASAHVVPARIGPNAITRIAEALAGMAGPEARRRVFLMAQLLPHLQHPPEAMVPDDEVARLHEALVVELGPARAAQISAEAGRLTAEYLLANRIPQIAQRMLGLLPRRAALWVLLKAIEHHAWTFVGGGSFSWQAGTIFRLSLQGGPVCRNLKTDCPACAYYAATFEHLFRKIISADIDVIETACEAMGDPACVFEVRFG
jgi:divinyl protochlorophyllide a 8-vinyl-reductase